MCRVQLQTQFVFNYIFLEICFYPEQISTWTKITKFRGALSFWWAQLCPNFISIIRQSRNIHESVSFNCIMTLSEWERNVAVFGNMHNHFKIWQFMNGFNIRLTSETEWDDIKLALLVIWGNESKKLQSEFIINNGQSNHKESIWQEHCLNRPSLISAVKDGEGKKSDFVICKILCSAF